MNPVAMVIFPIILLGVGFFYARWWSKHYGASYREYYMEIDRYQSARLAVRLGLALVEGEPHSNIAKQHDPPAAADFGRSARAPGFSSVAEVRLRMAGTPFVHPMELFYHYRAEAKAGFQSTTVTNTLQFVFRVKVDGRVPRFEVYRRFVRPEFEFTPVADLPEQPTGDPVIDARFVCRCADNRLAPLLIPALRWIADVPFAYMIGEQSEILCPATLKTASALVVNAEYIERALELAAASIDNHIPTTMQAPISPVFTGA